MQRYGQEKYKQTEITTADRGRLVVLLYDAAIDFLKNAKQSTKEGNFPGKANNINRAQDIIEELQFSLNMEKGGEIAKNLMSLYRFMYYHLVRAKISRDGIQNIDEVIAMLSRLNEAWHEVIERPEVRDIRDADQPAYPGLSRGIQV
jgi:flagellar protein FliS